jgi:predicted PurR-regulated permease PerM
MVDITLFLMLCFCLIISAWLIWAIAQSNSKIYDHIDNLNTGFADMSKLIDELEKKTKLLAVEIGKAWATISAIQSARESIGKSNASDAWSIFLKNYEGFKCDGE